jgi:hypothetical protein
MLLCDYETEQFDVRAGVPQGSPLSPILFMLYNSELFEICRKPFDGLSSVGFADDLNVLVYGRSTESNCRALEGVHRECLAWAKRFGMKFAPQKYELIHFTTASKRFNLSATVNFEGVVREPTDCVRVLGVWFDPKLKWTVHARKVKEKLDNQRGALARITTSTWGATLARSRLVYSSVIRPTLAYAAPIWHTPTRSQRPVGPAAMLQSSQSKCLRIVAGAYKATPVKELETETFIPPIDPVWGIVLSTVYHYRITAVIRYDTIRSPVTVQTLEIIRYGMIRQ